MNKEQLDKELHVIASEIEGFLLSGKVKAVGAIIVTEDGQIHTRVRYIPGGRIPLLAGSTLLQQDIARQIQHDEKGIK